MGGSDMTIPILAATFALGLAAAADDVAPAPVGKGAETPAVTTPTETRAKSDEALEVAVSRELEDDHRVNAMKIKVAVRGAVVTLTGTAASLAEKEAAEATVKRVSGVRQVENQLVLHEPGAPEPGTSVIPEVPKAPAH